MAAFDSCYYSGTQTCLGLDLSQNFLYLYLLDDTIVGLSTVYLRPTVTYNEGYGDADATFTYEDADSAWFYL